jgi:heme exporter protein C
MSDISTKMTARPSLSDLANPTRFLNLVRILLPWLGIITVVLFIVGMWLSFAAPEDYQQGRTVRIMFIHVPAVWSAMFAYMVMVSSALGVLVWRHPLADVAARAAAPLGAAFTFLGLITGSIWGKPMWGTWWVWDARLTSFLVLFIIYLGLIALWRAIEEPAVAARPAAVFILIGAINVPIIKFSVDWWNTLHQPASVFRADGPSLSPEFLWPLLIMAVAYSMLFLTLHLMAMRNEILRRRIRSLQITTARRAERGHVAQAGQNQ